MRKINMIKRRLYKIMAWIRSKTKSTELYPELRCGVSSTEWVDGTRDEYLRAWPKNLKNRH